MTTPHAADRHEFKGFADWVKVFEAGTRPDSRGKVCTFSRGDIDQMIDNHRLGAAPAVLGHPQHNDPAYAWVGQYKRDGDAMFAKFKDVHPGFEAGVQSGAYRNRSLSIYKDPVHGFRVRHVGWLGAAPPAIDGFDAVAFAAPEGDCMEFAAPGFDLVWGLEGIAKTLRRLRDQMIADKGLEVADAALPQWEIDGALEACGRARQDYLAAQDALPAAENSLFQQPPGDAMSFTQQDLDRAASEAEAKAKLEAQAASDIQAQEFAKQAADLATLRAERQGERIGAALDKLVAQGRVTPAERPGMAEFMVALEGVGQTFDFARADKSTAQKTPAEYFADFMASRAPVIKLGAVFVADDDPANQFDVQDSAAIARAANEFMASEAVAGRAVNIAMAVDRVMAAGKA